MTSQDIETIASFLYDGGWRAGDRAQLVDEYCVSSREADLIAERLADYELRAELRELLRAELREEVRAARPA